MIYIYIYIYIYINKETRAPAFRSHQRSGFGVEGVGEAQKKGRWLDAPAGSGSEAGAYLRRIVLCITQL